jgi:malate dehydrogenase (oxaloacetate-decarboxylating)
MTSENENVSKSSASKKSSAGYSITARILVENKPGSFAKVVQKAADQFASLAEVTLLESNFDTNTRDVTFNCKDEFHASKLLESIRSIPGIAVADWQDDTFALHRGGKLTVEPKIPIKTFDDLSRAYTPGVARVCSDIHSNPDSAYEYTIKRNAVAVISDGSAVLGLGNIGPESAMPVMEGKAVLFKQFANIDAYPICLNTQDTEEIIKTVKYISPGFGGINLEDISAPRCFEIEERLQAELDIPVFHDDQHGTAVVVLAGLINALKLTGKKLSDLKVVVNGFGAGGVACTKILLDAGVKHIIPCDSVGIVYRGRSEQMNKIKEEVIKVTNPDNIKGRVEDAMKGADVFLGVSKPGVITREMVKTMAKDAIMFALSNPVPEIMPHEIEGLVKIIATGRSDYANQINNVLCFPGIFRGALDSHATRITPNMKVAAAYAIAESIKADELKENYIVPNVFKQDIGFSVAEKVKEAAIKDGVTRNLNVLRTFLTKPHAKQ